LAFTVAMAVSADSSSGFCNRNRICTLVIVLRYQCVSVPR
jgi:hypothetical protein